MEWAYVSGDHRHVASGVLYGGTGWGRRACRADGGVTVLGTGLGGGCCLWTCGKSNTGGGVGYLRWTIDAIE